MKKLSFLTFLLFILFTANSQHTLSGKVFLQNENNLLKGAKISLPDLNKIVLTDEGGNYTLSDLPSGEFLIECRYNNKYYSATTINIKGNTELNFTLEESVLEIEELTVTGSSQSEFLSNNPVPIKVINQQTLMEQSSANIIESISTQPGVNMISTGAAIGKPVIRGLGYNRIITLQNGIRQEGQQWGDEHGIEIDEFSVEKVEIIKGPGSLMYGSDAIAGVINFLGPDPLPNGKIKSSFVSGFSSNNKLQSYSFLNSGNIKGINWSLRGTYKLAGNYKNRMDGYVYNSGFEEKDINGSIGVIRKWGYSTIRFSSFNQHVAMPEGERDSLGRFIREVAVNDTLTAEETLNEAQLKEYRIDLPSQKINHHRVISDTRIFFKRFSVPVTGGFQQNNRGEYANLMDPEEPELFFTLNSFHGDVKINLNEYKGWKFSSGISGMYQTNKNTAEEYIIPDYNLTDLGTFFIGKRKLGERTFFSGGIRFDNRNIQTQSLYLDSLEQVTETASGNFIKFEEKNLNYQAVTGSVGITTDLNESVALKLNFARGFRSPTISEISSNGKHEGALRYEIGNSNLKPEISLQADLGLAVNTTHFTVDIEAFANSIDNFIYIQKLSAINGGDSIVDIDEPVPAFKFQSGNALLYGGEISTDIHPHPWDWLHIENSFSLVNGDLKNMPDSMRNLPFTPAPVYRGELRCEFENEKKKLSNFYFYVGISHNFEQNRIYSAFGTESMTPAYTLLNSGAGITLRNKSGLSILSIILNVSNITDVTYQNHLSRLKYAPLNPANGNYGIYNMGRNFSIKLFIPINIKK